MDHSLIAKESKQSVTILYFLCKKGRNSKIIDEKFSKKQFFKLAPERWSRVKQKHFKTIVKALRPNMRFRTKFYIKAFFGERGWQIVQNNVLAPIYGPDLGTEHHAHLFTRDVLDYIMRQNELTTKIVQPNTLPFSCCSSNLQFYPHLENCHKIVSLKSYKEKVRIKEAGRHYICVKCNLKTFFKLQVHHRRL